MSLDRSASISGLDMAHFIRCRMHGVYEPDDESKDDCQAFISPIGYNRHVWEVVEDDT
jgi:hypothetical protein